MSENEWRDRVLTSPRTLRDQPPGAVDREIRDRIVGELDSIGAVEFLARCDDASIDRLRGLSERLCSLSLQSASTEDVVAATVYLVLARLLRGDRDTLLIAALVRHSIRSWGMSSSDVASKAGSRLGLVAEELLSLEALLDYGPEVGAMGYEIVEAQDGTKRFNRTW